MKNGKNESNALSLSIKYVFSFVPDVWKLMSRIKRLQRFFEKELKSWVGRKEKGFWKGLG